MRIAAPLLFLALQGFAQDPVIQPVDLAPVNPETYGIFSEEESGIPVDLWAGLSHDHIEKLLSALPKNPQNTLVRGMCRKLYGASTKVPPQKGGENLLALRVKRLLLLGAMEEAYALAKRYPEVLSKEEWTLLQFHHALLLENHQRALKVVGDALGQDPENPSFLKAIVILKLLQNQKDQALLSLSLFEDKAGEKDQDFVSAAKDFASGKALQASFNPKDFGEFKLLLRSNPKVALSLQWGAALPHDASFKKKDFQARALLLEEAILKGLLDISHLKEVYDSFEEKPSPVGSQPKDVIALPPEPFNWKKDCPKTRALLYKKVRDEKDPLQKRQRIQDFINHCALHKKLDLSLLMVPYLQDMKAQGAPALVKAMIDSDQQEKAKDWFDALSPAQKVEAAPLMILRSSQLSLETKRILFASWQKKQGSLPLTVLGAFEALVPGVTQFKAFMPSHGELGTRDTRIWLALLSFGQQKGMALTHALVGLDQGPSILLLKVLCDLGFKKEAGALALEFIEGALQKKAPQES